MAEILIRVEPEDQAVDPDHPAAFTVHVVNQSGVVDRVAFDILGSAGPWSQVDPPAVALFPGADARATVVVTPPPGTPLGAVPLGIRGVAETSGFVEVAEANLNVGATRVVEAELRPRTASGKRRATSVVVLRNLGNAPTRVSVVATDPDDAIVFDAPAGVQVGPGMEAELPLRMRLPARQKQGATLPYKVLVEGGEAAQALDGQVHQPPKQRWPILAALMVLALLAAAFMFLKPEDSVAIKDGKADEPITTTVPGLATTVPAESTTAAPVAGGTPAGAGGAPVAPATGAGGGTGGAPAPGAAPAPAAAAAVAAKPGTGEAATAVTPTTKTKPVPCNPNPAPRSSAQPLTGMTTVLRNQSKLVVNTAQAAGSSGDPILVKGVPMAPLHGTVAVSPDKMKITYTPARDYTGNDSFVYTVGDSGGGEASAEMQLCIQ